MQPLSLDTEARRRAVAWAVALTTGTPLAPRYYERQLLARFERGELTLDQIEQRLAAGVYHLLYHSRATHPPDDDQLRALLGQSRAHNAAHQITGLLLYGEGRFVQVLEGPEAAVRAVYARIRTDPRHAQVVTVREGPGPPRRFADWHMGFGPAAGAALERVLAAIGSEQPLAGPPPDNAHLRALLQAFGAEAPEAR